MPPITMFAQLSAQLIIKLSKLIKEAKQLGCEIFSGSIDVVVARNWLKSVSDTLTDMELEDDLKLRVATRLIDESVATLWDNLKLRSNTQVTWDMFVQEFNEQFYTRFHRNQKRKEFFRLKQFGKTIIKYETDLRELAEFVPELANSKEYMCFKFEEGLTLEIRAKMSISGSQSYKEVMQLALRVEKLTS